MMRRRVFTALNLFILGTVLFTWPQPASADCAPVKATGTTLYNPVTDRFEGGASFVIGGQTFAATSSTAVVSQWQAGNGTTHAVTSHTFDFGGGNTITTLDKAIMAPTATPNVFRLHSILTITGGTGIYANASGQLSGPGGTIYFNTFPFRAEWVTVGRLCW